MHRSKTFDYVLVDQHSSHPVLALVLSTKSYGRDGAAPEPAHHEHGGGHSDSDPAAPVIGCAPFHLATKL
ncbi:hypothetical protein ACFSC4_22870 [Deinococcus malanensis]|nr:hypothetical protein [Deinococcus malanensis]